MLSAIMAIVRFINDTLLAVLADLHCEHLRFSCDWWFLRTFLYKILRLPQTLGSNAAESSSSSWRRGIWIPILALPVLYAAQDFLVSLNHLNILRV